MSTTIDHEHLGAQLADLQIHQRIQGYFFARGDWYVTTNEGERIVLTSRQVPAWVAATRGEQA